MLTGNTRAFARLTHAKLQKMACARIGACNFGIRTLASEHILHIKDARHKCALHEPCTLATRVV